MEIVLRNMRDLEHAAKLVSWLNRPAVDKVEILLPSLDSFERQRSAKELRFLFNDCGCLWGAPAFVVAFAWFFFARLHAGGFSGVSLAYAVLVGLSVALGAKLLGLAWSRWRLKHWFKRVMSIEHEIRAAKEDVTQ